MSQPPQKLPMGKPAAPQGGQGKPAPPAKPGTPGGMHPHSGGHAPRPAKGKGPSVAVIVLSIIGGVALLSLLGCGGFVWYVSSKVKEELAAQDAAAEAARAREEIQRQQREMANRHRQNNNPWQPPVRPTPNDRGIHNVDNALDAMAQADVFRQQQAMRYLKQQELTDAQREQAAAKVYPQLLARMNVSDHRTRTTAREMLEHWEVSNSAIAAQCVKDLNSGDAHRANEAARWLAENVIVDEELSPQVTSALIGRLQDAHTRHYAANALQFWVTEDDVPGLVEAATTAAAANNGDSLRLCVQLLTNLGDSRALPVFATYLKTRHDRNTAKAAFTAIGVDAAPTLIPFINSEDSSVRGMARELLAEWEVEPAQLLAQSKTDLQSGDYNRQREAIRYLNAMELEEDDPAQTEIATALIGLSENQRLRYDALRCLKKWATADNVPKLIELLNHEDHTTKTTAREILVALKDPRAVGPIGAGLSDNRYRYDAQRSLIAMGPVAESAFWPHVTNEEWIFAKDMCEALGQIGTKRSIPILEGAKTHDSSFVKRAAEDAITQIELAKREPVDLPGTTDAEVADEGIRKMRTWTDASGSNTIEALFIKFESGKVRLRTRSGKFLSLGLSQLSVADRQYVMRQMQREP